MKKIAIIVAGGKGLRMNSKTPKQFLLINKRPLLMYTLERFIDFDTIILVLPKQQIKKWSVLCKKYHFDINHIIAEGGKSRFHSVKNGLRKVDNNSIVAIHDGVRPLVSKNIINNLLSKIKPGFGTIPILPIKDSIKKIEKKSSENINREYLYRIQTPQCFISSDIKKSYAKRFSKNFTDDSSVFQSSLGKIKTIAGEEKNIKITTQEDVQIASALLSLK